jgi:hypothetical protein
MVEGSEGWVGLGEAILGDHGLYQVVEVVEEGGVEEGRPVFPFRSSDDHMPSEAILVEDLCQSGMDSTMDPFWLMVKEGRGLWCMLMDMVECCLGPMFMTQLPGEAQGSSMGIDRGRPDSKLSSEVGGGGLEGKVKDIAEAVVYPLVEMLVVDVEDGSRV